MPIDEAVRLFGGTIHVLDPQDEPELHAHFLRLGPESSRSRFNGVVDDAFIARYAASCFKPGVTVLGYVEGGAIHAAAELHASTRPTDETAEIAFSVERHWRRKGIGSALFKALLMPALQAGYERLRVITGARSTGSGTCTRHQTTAEGQLIINDLADLAGHVTPFAPAA
ncbi:MAG: GNAT family N-acetyltransferase [Xanthobacteraceae bacterium]